MQKRINDRAGYPFWTIAEKKRYVCRKGLTIAQDIYSGRIAEKKRYVCRKGIEFKKGEKSGLGTDIAEKNWVFAEKD